LNGTYELSLSGRQVVANQNTKTLDANGTATFDGQGNATLTLTADTFGPSNAFGTSLVYKGTYTISSNCTGTISITSGDTASFPIVLYGINAAVPTVSFLLAGSGATYAYSGTGTVQPAPCATSTLSGGWAFSAGGTGFPSTSTSTPVDLNGSLQFDGNGNVTAAINGVSTLGATSTTASGTYTVNSACVGTFSLTSSGVQSTGTFSIDGPTAGSLTFTVGSSILIFDGSANVFFQNPGRAVVNGASFLAAKSPAGSVFSIFGTNLATQIGGAVNVPLPTTVLTTSVTVNGESAPLFYVSPTQINAQMPEDIQAGVATIVVTNGSSTSNSVAVTIPSTGTPGIFVYNTTRAVVINADGSTNSSANPAKVGDVLVVYFTGGGPVNASGTLVTGTPAPSGLSPVTGMNTVKLNGVNAVVNYMGLTPGSIGLYQANFVVPTIAAGDKQLVITIAGQASNFPLVSISN
jgi:uncharacterized protein (TIGR03437 family)